MILNITKYRHCPEQNKGTITTSSLSNLGALFCSTSNNISFDFKNVSA